LTLLDFLSFDSATFLQSTELYLIFLRGVPFSGWGNFCFTSGMPDPHHSRFLAMGWLVSARSGGTEKLLQYEVRDSLERSAAMDVATGENERDQHDREAIPSSAPPKNAQIKNG
jgi:hypothetical protein